MYCPSQLNVSREMPVSLRVSERDVWFVGGEKGCDIETKWRDEPDASSCQTCDSPLVAVGKWIGVVWSRYINGENVRVLRIRTRLSYPETARYSPAGLQVKLRIPSSMSSSEAAPLYIR